jgi:excinuclease UvrABC ATPase subunit
MDHPLGRCPRCQAVGTTATCNSILVIQHLNVIQTLPNLAHQQIVSTYIRCCNLGFRSPSNPKPTERQLPQQLSTNDQRSTTNDQRSTTNDQRSTTNGQRSTVNEMLRTSLSSNTPTQTSPTEHNPHVASTPCKLILSHNLSQTISHHSFGAAILQTDLSTI